MPKPASAVVIGNHPLAAACVEQLMVRQIAVAGVATDDPAVSSAVRESMVRASSKGADQDAAPITPTASLHELVETTRPDVLFSVGHLEVIESKTLTLVPGPKINFHDGPLPERAGLHTPMWAILEGSRTHAVTWHLMEASVDTGPIAERVDFDIEPHDTTFSLNLKIIDHGGRSLHRLLDRLVEGDLAVEPQGERRALHRKWDRPDCVLDFTQDALALDRLVRALDFGTTPNPIGRPIAVSEKHAMVVLGLQLTETLSIAAPGTIVTRSASTGRVEVATATTNVALTVAPSSAALVGAAFPEVDAATRRRLADLRRSGAPLDACRGQAHLTEWKVTPGPVHEHATLGIGDNVSLPVAVARMLAAEEPSGRLTFGYLPSTVDAEQAVDAVIDVTPVLVEFDPAGTIGALDALTEAALVVADTTPALLDLPFRLPIQTSDPDASLPIVVNMGTAEADALLVIEGRADGETMVRANGVAEPGTAAAIARRIEAAAAPTDSEAKVSQIPLLHPDDHERVLRDWNRTDEPIPDTVVDQLVWDRARRNPDATAIVAGTEKMSYLELVTAAQRVSGHLTARGLSRGSRVGVALKPSPNTLAVILGILRAGAAYVPIDPAFPAGRVAHMIHDSDAELVITDGMCELPSDVESVDVEAVLDAANGVGTAPSEHRPDDVMYVMYTSGSTGLPKGVVVTHRNVVNFLTAMDDHIQPIVGGMWMAVTTLSFDISVLELFFPLVHGATVALHGAAPKKTPTLDFSLFFFASGGDGDAQDHYRLLLDAARFGDEHGFAAVWTPERHFHAFGGVYPNPSVTAAALAMVTSSIDLRAGSCVLPLHDPVRVAEEWSVVDNLSNGRVGIAVAPGWHPRDFSLRPQNYGQSRDALYDQVAQLKRLWAGDEITVEGPDGPVAISTLPRPTASELPMWLTTAGSESSFEQAGTQGLGILTHLLGQSVDDLAKKIGRYRQAWSAAGHPGSGHVVLMVHTLVGADDTSTKELVREPMKRYLADSASLVRNVASSFPTFAGRDVSADEAFEQLAESDMDALLDHAFERYFATSGLFGSIDKCEDLAAHYASVGVDEIACLIDFGADTDTVLAHLPALDTVRQRFVVPGGHHTPYAHTLSHGVTHLQCTPSEARMILAEPEARESLRQLDHMLVGGEALPAELARELMLALDGTPLTNMYGPTETTIWSTCHKVSDADTAAGTIPIGQPVANTLVYVLDASLRPVGLGDVGELWIGGAGVTSGYHDRPDLTAERFRSNPFGPGRIYKTGDLVSWSDQGKLRYHGRSDQQVKIRGHRIELGEIEAWLERESSVREVVATTNADPTGDPVLVAYVTAGAVDPDPSELRARLTQDLPAHLVPSRIFVLEDMPRTANLKIDRADLAGRELAVNPVTTGPNGGGTAEASAHGIGGDPIAARRSDSDPQGAALGSAGATIAQIWREVLGTTKIRPSDAFFDLGGNSLQIVQVRRLLLERLDWDVSLVDLFRLPTIAALTNAHQRSAAPPPSVEATTPVAGVEASDETSGPRRDAPTPIGTRAARRAGARRQARQQR